MPRVAGQSKNKSSSVDNQKADSERCYYVPIDWLRTSCIPPPRSNVTSASGTSPNQPRWPRRKPTIAVRVLPNSTTLDADTRWSISSTSLSSSRSGLLTKSYSCFKGCRSMWSVTKTWIHELERCRRTYINQQNFRRCREALSEGVPEWAWLSPQETAPQSKGRERNDGSERA